jgi:hypothetical protein
VNAIAASAKRRLGSFRHRRARHRENLRVFPSNSTYSHGFDWVHFVDMPFSPPVGGVSRRRGFDLPLREVLAAPAATFFRPDILGHFRTSPASPSP